MSDTTVDVSATTPDERKALIRLGAQAAKDRDARNVAQVVTATVDAILATRPAPVVSGADVEKAAGALVEQVDTDVADQGVSDAHWQAALRDVRVVLAALGLTVADEGRAEA